LHDSFLQARGKVIQHGENDFAEIFENLADLEIILLDHQNNYVGHSNTLMTIVAKSYDILTINFRTIQLV